MKINASNYYRYQRTYKPVGRKTSEKADNIQNRLMNTKPRKCSKEGKAKDGRGKGRKDRETETRDEEGAKMTEGRGQK